VSFFLLTENQRNYAVSANEEWPAEIRRITHITSGGDIDRITPQLYRRMLKERCRPHTNIYEHPSHPHCFVNHPHSIYLCLGDGRHQQAVRYVRADQMHYHLLWWHLKTKPFREKGRALRAPWRYEDGQTPIVVKWLPFMTDI